MLILLGVAILILSVYLGPFTCNSDFMAKGYTFWMTTLTAAGGMFIILYRIAALLQR